LDLSAGVEAESIIHVKPSSPTSLPSCSCVRRREYSFGGRRERPALLWAAQKARFMSAKRAGMWGEVARVEGWKRWVVVGRGGG